MTFRSVLDPNFQYRNAISTDVRKTFERIREELNSNPARPAKEDAPNVVVMAGRQRNSAR